MAKKRSGKQGASIESTDVSLRGSTLKLTVTLKLGKTVLKDLKINTSAKPMLCTGCADSRATSGCP